MAGRTLFLINQSTAESNGNIIWFEPAWKSGLIKKKNTRKKRKRNMRIISHIDGYYAKLRRKRLPIRH